MPVHHRRSAGSAAVLVAVGVLMLVSLAVLGFVLWTGTGADIVPSPAVDVRSAVGLVAVGLGVVAFLAGVGFVADGIAARRVGRGAVTSEDVDRRVEAGLSGVVRREELGRFARSMEEAGNLVATAAAGLAGSSAAGDARDAAATGAPSLGVEELDGAGPETRARLDAAGVRTVRDLLVADPADIARRSGLDAGAVQYLRRQAEFLAIPDVGPGEAALLVAAGVQDTDHLATQDPAELARRLNDANRARHTVPGTFTVGETRHWVDAARERRP